MRYSVCASLPIGGASRVVANLAGWMTRRRWTDDRLYLGTFNPARRRLAPASWRSEPFGNGMRTHFPLGTISPPLAVGRRSLTNQEFRTEPLG